jgi:hypothetical protein
MRTDNIFLFLPPLNIAIVIGIMIGWEIGIAGGSLAALVYCFGEASKVDASPLFHIGGIVFTIVFILSASDSLYRILSKANFKERIAQHITDGKVLYGNRTSYVTSDEYEKIANDWVNKVVSDIRKHRGRPEANLFLVQWHTNQSVSMENWRPKDIDDTKRGETRSMLSSRIGWLEWLQMRL